MMRRKNVGWYAVRCCCQPKKIFGFLLLEDESPSRKILDRYGEQHILELRPMQEVCPVSFEELEVITQPIVSRELAVYSDDRPIEFWRTIPGFIEAAE